MMCETLINSNVLDTKHNSCCRQVTGNLVNAKTLNETCVFFVCYLIYVAS